jgi:hypothetical protein
MPTAEDARDAMLMWWQSMKERTVDYVCIPNSHEVVERFLEDQPAYQEYEATLREWASNKTWSISSPRWKAVRIGNVPPK